MNGRIEVGSSDDLQPGDREFVTVDGTSVCVMNVDGEYYAIESTCRHDGGPLCKGDVRPEIVCKQDGLGEPFKEEFGDRLTVTCPWHGWTYYLDTGVHAGDDSIALETYDVVQEENTLYLEG